MSSVKFLVGDVFDRMADIPDGSVDMIVTSPPFLALRSYLPDGHPNKGKEIGSEPTPAAFLSTLLALTREWRRILAPHGSICVELGDKYAGSGAAGGDYDMDGLREGQPKFGKAGGEGWPRDKSLCLLPTLYAACLAYGFNMLVPGDRIEPWLVRNLIVWHRPNPPVGALGDKVRPSTSYITTACVSKDRWFDLDAERTDHKYPGAITRATCNRGSSGQHTDSASEDDRMVQNPAGAPPLDCWIDGDVWTIPTAPYKGAHYATYPPALPRRLIRLMCPQHVCTVCGEPRRRKLAERDRFSARHMEFASWFKAQRIAAGVDHASINAAIGRSAIAANYERTDVNGAAIPSPEDWPTIKALIGADDEFDDLIFGARSLVEYRADGRPLAVTEKRNTYDRGGNGPDPDGNRIKANRVAPDEWSDCGHNNWRRGHVLDPFAGSGTTGQAAAEQGRDATLIDLDERNLDLARQRIGLFLEEAV